MIPTLKTERLILRPYAPSDWERYFAFCKSDRTKYMGGPLDGEKAWGWFTNEIASWHLNGFGTLAIEAEGVFVGFAGLVFPPGFPEPECGWGLFEGHTGKGYASEAGAAILAHTFATTDLQSIVSYIDVNNHASAAVSKRLGGVIDPDASGPWGDADHVYRYMRPTTGATQ